MLQLGSIWKNNSLIHGLRSSLTSSMSGVHKTWFLFVYLFLHLTFVKCLFYWYDLFPKTLMTATTALYCGFQYAWAMLSQKWAVFEPKVEFSQQSICWNYFFHESWYFAIPECFLFEDLRTVCKSIQQHRNALEKIIILYLFSLFFFFFFTDEWTPWRELICVRSQKEFMQLATLKKSTFPDSRI